MRALLLLTLGILTSSTAFSAPREKGLICFTDNNLCGIVTVNAETGRLLELGVLREDYNKVFAADTKWAATMYRDARVTIHSLGAEQFAQESYGLPVQHLNFVNTANTFMDLTPEAKSTLMEGGSCVIGAATCVGSVNGALATGGFMLFMSKVSCGWTGVKCGNAIIAYNNWKKLQERARLIELGIDPDDPNPTPFVPEREPGGSGGGGPSVGGAGGGGGVITGGSWGGTVTGREGSGGSGGTWRPIWH